MTLLEQIHEKYKCTHFLQVHKDGSQLTEEEAVQLGLMTIPEPEERVQDTKPKKKTTTRTTK